jgi:hypothetical protein
MKSRSGASAPPRGDPEDHVIVGLLLREVRLLNGTTGGLIGSARNGEQIVHSSIRRAAGVFDEPCFPNRAHSP